MASSGQDAPDAQTLRLPSMSTSTSQAVLPDLPPISALFLINFDVKAGYTIVWKQQVEGIELEGVVEYKSLPSGLHTVHDDLIYFVHDGHAGLSAFINEPCEDEEVRHARMISVGILVPLSLGRLGRAWRHAESLKEMAEILARDRKQTALLEAYWERNHAREPASSLAQDLEHANISPESPLASPSATYQALRAKGHRRSRSASDGTALIPPGHKLSSFHPAWSLMSLLDTFGPLIFPIHRAALLRKRILISCHAPVHQICDFVYDISVLSNIPLSVSECLPLQAPAHRLRPLFAIGVHDIPFLQENYAATTKRRASLDIPSGDTGDKFVEGWIACTTDSILAMKDTLWDMLITMPSPHTSPAAVKSSSSKDKIWPQVECPAGVPVKATQRDLRRFRALKLGLALMANDGSPPATPRTPSSTYMSSAEAHWEAVGVPPDAAEKIVEPTTWAALAYNGFMWWASAGEQARSDQVEESTHDDALLTDLVRSQPSPHPHPSATTTARQPQMGSHLSNNTPSTMADSMSSLTARRLSTEVATPCQEAEAAKELAIIAYFHRLTSSVLRVLADMNESAVMEEMRDGEYADSVDGEDEGDLLLPNRRGGGINGLGAGEEGEADAEAGGEEFEGPRVKVDGEALKEMGLDVWSNSDKIFVAEAVKRYFGRGTEVEGKGVEVCGIRIC
ncbi:hypothetical protein MKZ38_004248 [Zalerion maritima]|uniref:DUF4484 domain-containing protein n=1 Tax=Zalerion maritima TaxID=339359 RepID=A0AAD5RSW5_9PEZI|nr:hypothetical protein MKZ38_004248 [Zalerion maritima]